MKNVVIISSSPRINGNSETLCKEFMKGAKDSGNNAELISLREYNLKYCTGCFSCWSKGECFQNDGLNEIGYKLLKADVIVFATPVYFYSMSGQLKVFLDRLVPFYQKLKADIYIIATQQDADQKMMEATIEAIRGATRDCYEGCKEKGVIYAPGLGDKTDASNRTDLLSLAYEMGKKC